MPRNTLDTTRSCQNLNTGYHPRRTFPSASSIHSCTIIVQTPYQLPIYGLGWSPFARRYLGSLNDFSSGYLDVSVPQVCSFR